MFSDAEPETDEFPPEFDVSVSVYCSVAPSALLCAGTLEATPTPHVLLVAAAALKVHEIPRLVKGVPPTEAASPTMKVKTVVENVPLMVSYSVTAGKTE
jgi:hypothetical protein